MIGIVTSLPIEAGCLTSKRLRVGQTLSLRDHVLLHISGIGAERAKLGAQYLVTQGVTALISWGTAGGLANDLSSGQLIMPEKIIDPQSKSFLTNHELRHYFSQLLHHQFTVCYEPLLQSHEIITSIDAKQALFNEYQTVAVDMESAAVAAVAEESLIPFVALRTIVDSAQMSLPEWLPKTFNVDNEIQTMKFAWQLLRHPKSMKSLIDLGQSFSHAKSTLKQVAEIVGWRS